MMVAGKPPVVWPDSPTGGTGQPHYACVALRHGALTKRPSASHTRDALDPWDV